jgi:hypothetical protein
VEIVVFITGNDNERKIIELPPAERPYKEFAFPIENLPDGKTPEIENHPKRFKERIYYKVSASIKLSYFYPYCIPDAIWDFTFFNYKGEIKVEHLEEFRACLNAFLENRSLTEIIRNRELVGIIKRKCYSKLVKQGNLKNFNNTSLVLFHRPLNSSFVSVGLNTYPYTIHCINQTKKLGTLLLGDINLNQTLYELINFFEHRLEKVFFALTPLHGSKKNWNNDILKKIECPTFWVASAGTYNRFGHPSCKIFREISKRKCIPVWCSEINPVIYHFELEYECN